MIEVTVRIPHEDLADSLHAEREVDALMWLWRRFPAETKGTASLIDAIHAVNESGEAEVEAKVVTPQSSNLLPEDYLTHNQQDAWVRNRD